MNRKGPESDNHQPGRGYGGWRNFNAGPSTYTDGGFLDKIIKAAGLDTFAGSALVADLMSGPGKVGLGIQRLYPQHQFLFVDASVAQIDKARQASQDPRNQFVVADVRSMPQIASKSVDAAIARYSLKDLTFEEKIPTLQEIRRIMRPGATLAIADMITPVNPIAKAWLNEQHRMKQEFEWRNPQTEDHCYIPTSSEWLDFLRKAEFKAHISSTHMSNVTTNQWSVSHQVDDKQLAALNQFILKAPKEAKKAFNIREEDGLVKIEYPLTIIRAVA